MKASKLIASLRKQINKHGDLDVVVVGCYCSETDNITVTSSKKIKMDGDMKIIISTDLMTG